MTKAVADIVRTTLGPKSMLKMLMDPMGGIVLTNDGNAILREIDVQHPAAKSMIELARAQDEEVGDGTTSVIILVDIVTNFVTLPLLTLSGGLSSQRLFETAQLISAFRRFLIRITRQGSKLNSFVKSIIYLDLVLFYS